MGQFSWLDCKSGKQILDDFPRVCYLLKPNCFGGGHIVEQCYDGYGNFDSFDVYNLVAIWNREFLSKNPDFIIRSSNIKVSEFDWYEKYSDLSIPFQSLSKFCSGSETRTIGIDIACYDIDNSNLPYPIKITYDENAIYELCKPSDGDPNQGWLYDEEDEDYDYD